MDMNHVFELRPERAKATQRAAHQLVWPRKPGRNESMHVSVGSDLAELGDVDAACIDLVRISAAAFCADRLSARPATFSRSITLHVQVLDPSTWSGSIDTISDILHWLTADEWFIELTQQGRRHRRSELDPDRCSEVGLFSGGLDSFCGAVWSEFEAGAELLGHWDSPTVKRAQNHAYSWLKESRDLELPYHQIRIAQSESKREASTRSRSLLFMALGAALASARDAQTLIVPENGYTSLNPPLGRSRGGALSTRSTHPWTFAMVNSVLANAEIDVVAWNPFSDLSKGEVVEAAADRGLDEFANGVATTLSCGKLDGHRYKGGNPNYHCGLCVPCLVRRGAIAQAGIEDRTIYLAETLPARSRKRLVENRNDDIAAVRAAIERGTDDARLLALGPFPPDFDFDLGIELWASGLAELGNVELS